MALTMKRSGCAASSALGAMPARPEGDPEPLPYLDDADDRASGGLGVTLRTILVTETMRAFDPADQRSSGKAEPFTLMPASEALLDEAGPLLDELVELVTTRALDPYEASERLLREVAR